MKIYCQECGSPTEYASKKPNFCSGCGFNFTTKASSPSPRSPTQPLDEDSEENDVKVIDPRIYEMSGLDVNITANKSSKITFGDLFPQEAGQKGDEKSQK